MNCFELLVSRCVVRFVGLVAFERVREGLGRVNSVVLRARVRDGTIVGEKFNGLRNSLAASRRDVAPMAAVVLGRGTEVPRVGAFAVPQLAGVG